MNTIRTMVLNNTTLVEFLRFKFKRRSLRVAILLVVSLVAVFDLTVFLLALRHLGVIK